VPIANQLVLLNLKGAMLSDSLTGDRPDLSETRLLVERLQKKVDYLFKQLGLVYPDEDLPLYVVEARELVLANRDEDAVKVVREHTAVGILEARAIVEDMRKRLVKTSTGPAPLPSAEPNPWRDVPQATQQAVPASSGSW
jgi:hypothetical protein